MFDEPVPAFGRFRVTDSLGDGRFGPVHLGIDPESDQLVVIRTFADQFSAAQQRRLQEALNELCERPLDHASIATPIACGVENGTPYLVHSYLPGTSVDEFLRLQGPRPLADVALRVTHLAAAIDFAAAAGVFHGALTPRDILFAPSGTGVGGFGLAQAMREAGVSINAPTPADDVYALAAMTFELLVGHRFTGGRVRDALAPLRGAPGVDFEALVKALEPALATEASRWPGSALEFAALLHDATVQTQPKPIAAPAVPPPAVGRLSFGADDHASEARPRVFSSAPRVEAVPATPSPTQQADAGLSLGELALEHGTPEWRDDTPIGSHDDAAVAESFDDLPGSVDDDLSASVGVPHDEPHLRSQTDSDRDDTDFRTAYASPHDDYDAPLQSDALAARMDYEAAPEPPPFERPRPVHRVQEPSPLAPPVLSGGIGGTSDGAGRRAIGIAAAIAVVLVLVVVAYLYLVRRPTQSTAGTGAGSTETEETVPQRVEDLQPVTPGGADAAPGADPTADPTASPSASAAGSPAPAPPPTASPSATPPVAGARPSERSPETAGRAAPAERPRAAAAEPARPAASRPEHVTAAGQSASATHVDRAAEATAMGRVLVRSTPSGARVMIDGAARGETPVAIRDLPFGAHTIVVTAPGHPNWQQTVTLTAEQPSQSFEVALDGSTPETPSAGPTAAPPPPPTPSAGGSQAAAGLVVDSRPTGAQVWVDGAPVGVTPVVVPSITAGSHSVRIEMPGYRPWSTSVSVVAGQRTRVAASLEQ